MLIQLTNGGDHVGLYQTQRTDVENFQSDFDDAIEIANEMDNEDESLGDNADEILASKGFERIFAEEVYTDIL